MKEWKFRSVGILGQGLLGGLFTTVRASREDAEHFRTPRARGENVIFTLWHGVLLPLAYYHQGEGVVVLVSEHDDGEYITRVLHRFGYETVRGSSTRGGTRALRGLVREARAGKDLAITPDGPQGPAGEFKPGALVAAQLTGLPIIPVGLGVSDAWHFRSWDAFTVPKPLSRVRLVYGEPVRVPRGIGGDELDEWARRLGRTMHALTARANAAVGNGEERPVGGESPGSGSPGRASSGEGPPPPGGHPGTGDEEAGR